MPSSRSAPLYPPPKRMRLGTKSCAECRRRKVRCIKAPGSQICKECALHHAHCTSQTALRPSHRMDEPQDANAMRLRLEELEGVVRHLCNSVDFDIESLNPGELNITAATLRGLRPSSTPSSGQNDTPSRGTNSVNPSEFEGSSSSTDSVDGLKDAPLLRLFEAAMVIERHGAREDTTRAEPSVDRRIRATIASLDALIPSLDHLNLILMVTERYWPIWHAFPNEVVVNSDASRTDGVTRARHFILESMRSGKPAIVAKAALCLALCIQQLPASFKLERTSPPASPTALVNSYLISADNLISFDENAGGTIDGLECFMIQAKLYINMGKPRKTWSCYRRAMNLALLHGLQHAHDGTDVRLKDLFSHIWQGDRQFSLLLGLPFMMSETHPSLSNRPSGESIIAQIMYEFSIIAGHIIERNQNYGTVEYSATERIEQELQNCRTGIATSFLDALPNPSMPLEVIYGLQTVKLYYHNICRLLHLPYMLKSEIEKAYEHSRLAALHSSREMIKAFQTLRECSGSAVIICDFMDFQFFTAVLVLIINLLSAYQDDAHQQASDWELIHSATSCLKDIADAMECNVAGQAARLLELLSSAGHGTYTGGETFEAVIPYFGRVEISQIGKTAVLMSPPSASYEPEPFSNMVQFSANSFAPPSQNVTYRYFSDAELGIDWTSCLDMDESYDWSQVFDSAGPLMQ